MGLATTGIIPFGIIIAFAPVLFSFVFGADWHNAGVYASWLSIWVYFEFCNVPAVTVIPVIGIQKQFFFFGFVVLAIRIISIVVGGAWNSPITAIILYSASGSALNLGLILWVHIKMYRDKQYSERGLSAFRA